MGGSDKMAETKGSVFAKSVQKHAGRAVEKILQKVGKVDRTADEIFDDNVQNFNKQQLAANKLQKELNNYIRCIKAMQAASKTLYECMSEVYESEWTGHDLLTVQSQNIEMLWQDFGHKMTDQVLIPLNTYQSQFPELKKKIEKRDRKLVDYDGQRHSFQTLQASKKREEVKVARAKEQLEEAKRTFAVFNAELNEEMPALYDSRVLFYLTNLQTLFSAEQVFHSELSKVHGELESIINKLEKEGSQRTSIDFRRNSPPSPSVHVQMQDKSPSGPLPVENVGRIDPAQERPAEGLKDYEPVDIGAQVDAPPSPSTRAKNGVKSASGAVSKDNGVGSADGNHRRVEDVYDIPVGATTENLPVGVLYRVRSTYKYQAEDEDELSLELGDIVQVVEYEDPEEQEEGWLMGIKEATGRQGLFPANFTRPM